jgi:hypothetical protein
LLLHGILIFLVGTFYEAACVGFVHYTEHGPKSKAVLVTLFAGVLQITGIIHAINNIFYAACLVAGYGLGTWLAMTLRKD